MEKADLKWLYAVLLQQLLLISGCGGGGSSGSGETPRQLPTQPTQPPQPLESQAGCQAGEAARTTEVDGSIAGVWRGSLFDCSQEIIRQAILLVNSEGRFHLVSRDPDTSVASPAHLSGTLMVDGDTFDGSGTYFAHGPEGDYGTGMWVDGHSLGRHGLEGRWGADWGGYGYFRLDYDETATEVAFPGAAQGTWRGESSEQGLLWRLSDAGELQGEDAAGCRYSGEVSFSGQAAGQPSGVELQVAHCPIAGDYSGLLFWAMRGGRGELFAALSSDSSAMSFSLLFSIETYIPGEWVLEEPGYTRQWQIDPEGNISGADSDGCIYSGQINFAEAVDTGNAIEIDIANCTTSGSYTGVVVFSAPFGFQLVVVADSGGGESLELTLYKFD